MNLQPKERAFLKVCGGLTVAACLLAGLAGAGAGVVFATAYAAMAATCALWPDERRRPVTTSSSPRPSSTPARVGPTLTPRVNVRVNRAGLTRSLVGIVFAGLLLVVALLPQARQVSGGLVIGAMTLGSAAAWVRLSEDKRRQVPATLRCPLCREGFHPNEEAVSCEHCETIHHAECRDEWSRCAILGCESETRFGEPFRVRLERSKRVRS